MIRDALQWFLDLGQANQKEIEGRIYSDKALHLISKDPTPDPITVRNLSGLVDYVTENFDNQPDVLIHVASPTQVTVMSTYNRNMDRNILITAGALLPEIPFNRYQDVENFNILLQSCFVPNDHRAAILKIVGNIADDTEMRVKDDGVSQSVTAKTGIVTVDNVPLPNPVKLKPFRTFVEINQPESAFIFRMKKSQDGPIAAIFEADGGAWKLDAIEGIKKYLDSELSEQIIAGRVTIIA